ncbi:MAG: hypothetical protein ACTSP9_04305 [Promethearchaeota archaeon]
MKKKRWIFNILELVSIINKYTLNHKSSEGITVRKDIEAPEISMLFGHILL